jgi:1-acyl-sn-glycerol-3-phosphate acyltransferase
LPRLRTIRLLALALCLAAGFITAAIFPLFPKALRLGTTRLWSRATLAALGVKLEVEGELAPGPALLVANHVSWLDIFAINAVRPAVFVCKADVADWPGFGWLLAQAGTIFMRRDSAPAASRAMLEIRERLRAGASVAFFPEGTSTDGGEVLPFRPALFQAALDAGCPVQPLAVAYSSPAAVYAGDVAFWESLVSIAGARDLRLRLSALPSFPAHTRAEAARLAHELIGGRLRAGTLPADSGHVAPQARLVAVQAGRNGLVQ